MVYVAFKYPPDTRFQQLLPSKVCSAEARSAEGRGRFAEGSPKRMGQSVFGESARKVQRKVAEGMTPRR